MTAVGTAATVRRILAQLRADPRTVGLIVVVPTVLVTLLYFVFDGAPAFASVADAMMGVLPMLVMFLVTSVAMLRERTSGTLERLLTTPMRRGDLLAGYGIAFTAAAVLQAAVLVVVTRTFLGVHTAGSSGWVLAIAAASAAVGVATGLLASAFARTEFQAVQFMPLVIGPQVFLCGLLVDRSAMPEVLQRISDVLPMTYAVKAMREVATVPSPQLLPELAVLLGIGLVAVALAALSMPRKTG